MESQGHATSTSSYDADELRKFESLASDWWNPQGKFKILHKINPVRLQYLQSCASLEQSRVLDVGCGGGLLSEAMARQNALVTGIDLGEKALQAARLHLEDSNLAVDYQCIDIQALASREKACYDIITCLELLEHVPDPAAIISSCSELAVPGGHLFFSTLNRKIVSFLSAIIGAEYLLKVIPKGTHSYDKFIRPSELAQTARAEGLELVGMTGFSYNLLTGKFTLSPQVQVNYLMYFRKPLT